MAFGINFWNTPQHRVFHYEPMYYDEHKERIDELYKKYGKDRTSEEMKALAAKEGISLEEQESTKRYIPGMSIRGSFSRTLEEKRKSKEDPRSSISLIKKLILVITIGALAFAAYYVSKGLVLMLM